jgi:hypothetical protein
VTPRELTQRRRVLFTMLTVLDFRYAPGSEPALLGALRTWLSGWPGIGRIVAGMSRQGVDLQLARHGADGWRATFYTAGRTAHSQTSAVGSSMAPEPWVAVQQAAWEGLRRREGAA